MLANFPLNSVDVFKLLNIIVALYEVKTLFSIAVNRLLFQGQEKTIEITVLID